MGTKLTRPLPKFKLNQKVFIWDSTDGHLHLGPIDRVWFEVENYPKGTWKYSFNCEIHEGAKYYREAFRDWPEERVHSTKELSLAKKKLLIQVSKEELDKED